ncbi:hypothetical protein T484DRAFT_2183911 [Baffinella frigidus]|nr:hypothetical protein T484DRAFT_2183911 [Cryptophyta sp. CCMP2293]
MFPDEHRPYQPGRATRAQRSRTTPCAAGAATAAADSAPTCSRRAGRSPARWGHRSLLSRSAPLSSSAGSEHHPQDVRVRVLRSTLRGTYGAPTVGTGVGCYALPGSVALPGSGALPGSVTLPGSGALPRSVTLPGSGALPGSVTLPGSGALPGSVTLPGARFDIRPRPHVRGLNSIPRCSEGYGTRLPRVTGVNVTTSRYTPKKRIQFRFKSVSCSLLSGTCFTRPTW